ncbi:GxxExxY protein [Flavobacterium akiainvivens]|uniref:GxxExxY protein n=1 Tax=Flavobacterium akiainvivens TaxID=1202724 RepID=A0A0M8MBW4_9FLAO|nr:GxxExxY protein [Flavobacterium akiainvivens]KOS06895.1 GxxExxY protein [Flavobacterium akiainvivens]SFQ69587.1 GxxExxY protein [Flavobacterium akiainvivens]
MTENEIAKIVLDCAIKVHKRLGPGLLESAYCECLCYELYKAGLFIEKEKPMPLMYDEVSLTVAYRADIVIENKFIVEVKTIEEIKGIHMAQLLTYLRLADYKLGMLINFNTTLIKDGIRRIINGTL